MRAVTDTLEVSTEIAAPAGAVWAAVSDVTRMGEWSPEAVGGRWLGDATGPVAGARFRGSNRNGWRRWSTLCTVVAAEPGREFTFEVSSLKLPVARWSYRFDPLPDGGTRVTESWTDRRTGALGAPMRLFGGPVTGSPDRRARNAESMRVTLDRLKAALERG